MRLSSNLVGFTIAVVGIVFVSLHFPSYGKRAGVRAASNPQSAIHSPQSSREDFLKIIDRPRAPLEPAVKEIDRGEGWLEYHLTFSSDAQKRIPGILVKPAEATDRRATVIVLHATGSRKERQLPLMNELVKKGFITVAIDAPYHGERALRGRAEYAEALMRAYFVGNEHPFLYDTVWEVMRLVDYLDTRPDVDTKRIGLIGFSKGGMETALAAAMDPRIAVAVPCIGVQSIRWSLQNNAWKPLIEIIKSGANGVGKNLELPEMNLEFVQKFLDRIVPGIYSQFDGPSILPLIAPRPLLLINSDSDPVTPLPSVMECATAARKAYAAAHAPDKFALRIQKSIGHRVTAESRQAAIDWFVKWLRPSV